VLRRALDAAFTGDPHHDPGSGGEGRGGR
jgi:hypothetical protein